MKKITQILTSAKGWTIAGTLATIISIYPFVHSSIKQYIQEYKLECKAKKGNVYAQAELGYKYFKDGDSKNALIWCKKAADNGHPTAMANIATHFYNNKDYFKALEWGKHAANLGDPHAQYLIGMIYLYGYEVIEPDYKLAFKYLESAKEKGHIDAIILLGNCFLEGIGIEKDIQMATSLFQQASLLKDKK